MPPEHKLDGTIEKAVLKSRRHRALDQLLGRPEQPLRPQAVAPPQSRTLAPSQQRRLGTPGWRDAPGERQAPAKAGSTSASISSRDATPSDVSPIWNWAATTTLSSPNSARPCKRSTQRSGGPTMLK